MYVRACVCARARVRVCTTVDVNMSKKIGHNTIDNRDYDIQFGILPLLQLCQQMQL